MLDFVTQWLGIILIQFYSEKEQAGQKEMQLEEKGEPVN